jgi:hypothetical protein
LILIEALCFVRWLASWIRINIQLLESDQAKKDNVFFPQKTLGSFIS